MSLSLKLELHQNNKVLVTNCINQEKKEVTLNFIKEITRNSLDSLIQYEFYEICINADRVWRQVENFNAHIESAKEISIEEKFGNIMANDRWVNITDHERQMYNKALPWVNTYDPKKSIGRTITVIHQLEKFGWQVIHKDCNYIIMYNSINSSNPTTMFIPNKSGMNKEILKTLINQADLTVEEFFSVT